MALSTRQVSDLLDVLGGERVGNWVASREGGGHAGWFIYLHHPDLGDETLIAATPDWDGHDNLAMELQYHGPDWQPRTWGSCNQTVPVPWTGRLDSDRKRWHYEVAKFIRCLGEPGGPLPTVDHGLPKSMQPTRGEWDAGAKARQAKIFRHILGLDDNPLILTDDEWGALDEWADAALDNWGDQSSDPESEEQLEYWEKVKARIKIRDLDLADVQNLRVYGEGYAEVEADDQEVGPHTTAEEKLGRIDAAGNPVERVKARLLAY